MGVVHSLLCVLCVLATRERERERLMSAAVALQSNSNITHKVKWIPNRWAAQYTICSHSGGWTRVHTIWSIVAEPHNGHIIFFCFVRVSEYIDFQPDDIMNDKTNLTTLHRSDWALASATRLSFAHPQLLRLSPNNFWCVCGILRQSFQSHFRNWLVAL